MSFRDQKYDIFNMFDKQWALVTAGDTEDHNAMTVSWGTLGTIWSPDTHRRSVATIFVRKSRFTLEYLQRSDYFTVCFFPEECRKALAYLGSHSGREEPDKVNTAGLHPIPAGRSIGYKEAERTFVCKKLFAQELLPESIPEEIRDQCYKTNDYHIMFIGEIEEVIEP